MGGDNYGFKGSLEEQVEGIVPSETTPAVDKEEAPKEEAPATAETPSENGGK